MINSLITAFLNSNLAMTMFAPGSAELMAEFHSTSETIGSLTVSIYVLGFVVGSSVLAPLSEMYGRFPIYSTSVFMYAAFTIGCAFSTNIGSFIAFRLLAGCAGSCTLVLCGGTLADVIAKENQGRWMSLFVLGPLAGPVVGPIAGGFVVQSIGWRWIFRIILIAVCILFTRSLAFLLLKVNEELTQFSTIVWCHYRTVHNLPTRDLCSRDSASTSSAPRSRYQIFTVW